MIAVAALAVAACQPAPEERFARAQDYFAVHEYRAAVLELKNALQAQPEFPEARLMLGRASYQLADFATAQNEFERALSQGLDRPAVWYELGRALLAQGDATGVIERVVPNLPMDSATAEQLVMLGNTYLALDNQAQAAAHYDRALQMEQNLVGALVGQAVIARSNGDTEAADRLLSRAVEANPDSPLAWRARGNFLQMVGKPADAAGAYDRSIASETGATPIADGLITRVNRVSVLLDAGETELAAQRLEQLKASFPNHPVVRLLTGRVAYARGDYDAAESELREYLADIPNDLRGFALLGAVNFSQNHLRQAEMYLQRAVRANVGGDMAARLLAETQLRLNKPGEAMRALGAFGGDSEIDPALAAMYGRAQLGLGDTAAALDYFERGAAAGELDPAVSLTLAAGFFSAGEYDRAVDVLEAMPETGDARYRREALMMAAHIQDGDPDSAVAVGDRLLTENPDDATALATVGVMRHTLGDTAGARQAFERALSIDAGHRAAGFALSRMEIEAGNARTAERLLRNTLEAHPDYVPALATLAGVLAEQDRLDEMRTLLERGVEQNPDNLAARLLKIRAELMRQDPEAALATIAAANDEFPDEPALLHAEALARVQQGQTEIALARFREAAGRDRNNPTYEFDLAAIALNNGDTRLAKEAIEAYRALKPDNYSGLATHVAILSKDGDFDAARSQIDAYTTRNPDDTSAVILNGDVSMAAGDAEAAVESYEAVSAKAWSRAIAIRLARAYQVAQPGNATLPLLRWLEEHPDDNEVRRMYGQFLEAKGYKSAAVAEYEKLVEAGEEDPIALNNLAWQYAEQGRDGAVDLARRAHELAPDNGSITDTYGWILFKRGEIDAALTLLEKAATQSPNNPEIKFHLAAVHAKLGNRQRASEIVTAALSSDRPFPSREQAQELAQSL